MSHGDKSERISFGVPVKPTGSERSEEDLEQTELRFRLFVESVSDYAIYMLNRNGRVVTWNAGAERFKGYKANEIIGKHFSIFYPPEDIQAGKAESHLAAATANGRMEDEGWRVRKDGSRFWVSATITALRNENGELIGFGKVTRDLTLRRKAEEDARTLAEEKAARAGAEQERARAQALAFRTARLQDLTSAFAETLTPDQVIEIVFARVLPALGADGGSIALVSASKDELELVSSVGYSTEVSSAFRRFPIAAHLPHSDAVRTHTPIFLESTAEINSSYPQFVQTNRLTALASLPLTFGSETMGVLGVTYRTTKSFSEDERRFAMALARQCAQALDRARVFVNERLARERAESAERRLTFLAEASKILSSSLDYDQTLKALSDLAVPRLGDWCGIEVVDEDGTAKQLAVSHVDPAKVEWARELRARYPPNPNDSTGVPEVLRTGKSQIYPTVTDEMLVRGAVNDEHLQLLRKLGLKSVLIAPLKTPERVLGAITLVSAESKITFGPADLSLAEELGARAALAIENARLYREAQVAIRKREEFLSVASHELRTPVTSLQLHLSSVLRTMSDEGSQSFDHQKLKRRIQRADDQVARLTILIGHLLDVGRLAAGKLAIDKEPVELTNLAREVVRRFEDAAKRSGGQISVLSKCDVHASADPSRMDQVLTNLISNAVKYGQGKPIEVTIEEVDGRARISVRDRGIGIDPSDHTRIFDRFERASSARNYGGIGLGLWIVKQTMELHGGKVSVESSPGTGSTFIVEFPVQAETERPNAT